MSNVDQVIRESVEQFQAMANRLVEETAVAVREQLLQQMQQVVGTNTIAPAAPPKRKRGRPSKKDIAAREAASAAPAAKEPAAKAKANGNGANGTAEKKPRKKRKPLSPENKAKLAANLAKARAAKKAAAAEGTKASAQAEAQAE